MTVINWQMVTALIAGCALISTAFLFSTRAIVRDEIAKLNGTYLRKELAIQRFAEIEKHFDYIKRQHEEG